MVVYSVSQITKYLRNVLEQDSVLQDIWISGEVANLARPGSGHSYFSLRDSDTTLRCVMFRGSQGSNLLSSGGAVVAHGRISVYEIRGDLQLIVDIIQPKGVGDLQLKLEELKFKLEAEGLFEPSRKRPLPKLPRRVGIVTSPSGAVWHDIQTVIQRRFPLTELILAPAKVQGKETAVEVVDALAALSRISDVDVVMVARGGGSLEDLWPFNEESVARAIFAYRVPVISAIGHETDTTIADLVADHRAPTPSAAAEMVVPDKFKLYSNLIASQQSLSQNISAQISSNIGSIELIESRLTRSLPDFDSLRIRIDDMIKIASKNLKHSIDVMSERTDGLAMRLDSLSPKDTMRRGYAIVQTQVDNSALVSNSNQVYPGDLLDITVAQGSFVAEVTSIQNAEDIAESI